MSSLSVAFVGAGSMSREHLRAFRDVPSVRLAGIHSRTRARAEALASEFNIPVVADSIAELHAKTGAGLAVVSVPELAANAVLKDCFRHGWTVLAEKPAGYDMADAESIRAEAARRSRRVYVALNRRHYSATCAAAAKLADDEGQRFIRIQDQQDQAAALAAGQPAKVVENWMYANSIHVIDYLATFGRGEVTAVQPVVAWDPARPGTVVARISFSSGDIGMYEGVWNGPGPWAVTVSTPSQRLEMRPLEQLGVQKRGERRLDPQPVHEWDTAFKAGFRLQAQKAVAAALGQPTDLPTLDEGLQTMRLVSRVFAPGEFLKRCLIHLYSPPYLLSALAALAALHPGERVAGTILVQLPGASDEALAEILRVVRELAAGHASIERIEGVADRHADAAHLRRLLGAAFDEFYYAHDATGDICRRLAQLYPEARKVCTGDAFGMIYAADFVAGYQSAGSAAAMLRRWLRALAGPPPVRPGVAALVLPVDASGRGLSGIELVCCPKSDFLEAIRGCHANAAGLRGHMRELLDRSAGRKRCLLLTETYAEAGHLLAARETEMYAGIVRKYCERGGVVLVKPHPLEAPGKAERIARALHGDYEIIGVEPAFGRYPIEIWEELLRGCTVISSAYPVLSLKYVYGIDVVQPMDDAMIDRWIEPAHRKWSRDSLRLYMEPLVRLASWDGRSMLWPPQERT